MLKNTAYFNCTGFSCKALSYLWRLWTGVDWTICPTVSFLKLTALTSPCRSHGNHRKPLNLFKKSFNFLNLGQLNFETSHCHSHGNHKKTTKSVWFAKQSKTSKPSKMQLLKTNLLMVNLVEIYSRKVLIVFLFCLFSWWLRLSVAGGPGVALYILLIFQCCSHWSSLVWWKSSSWTA